jgi:hypothetical protein
MLMSPALFDFPFHIEEAIVRQSLVILGVFGKYFLRVDESFVSAHSEVDVPHSSVYSRFGLLGDLEGSSLVNLLRWI